MPETIIYFLISAAVAAARKFFSRHWLNHRGQAGETDTSHGAAIEEAAERLALRLVKEDPGNTVKRYVGSVAGCQVTLLSQGDLSFVVQVAAPRIPADFALGEQGEPILVVEDGAAYSPVEWADCVVRAVQFRAENDAPNLAFPEDSGAVVVRIRGDDLTLATVMTTEALASIRRGGDHARNLSVAKQTLTYKSSAPASSARAIIELVRWLNEVARRLSVDQSRQPAQLLGATCDRTLAPAARARALRLLQTRFPTEKSARSASLAVLHDPDHRLRVLAAAFLDRPEQMVEEIIKGEMDFDLCLETLRYLVAKYPETMTSAHLGRIFAEGKTGIRRAVAKALGQLHYRPAVPLFALTAAQTDAETASAIADALATIGGADAETVLAALLQRHEDTVCIAAAEALGAVGSVSSVEPLRHAGRGVFTSSALRAATSQAITAIQQRLGNVESGELSLVDTASAAGNLAVVDQAGGLSVAEPVASSVGKEKVTAR
jgi:hypothetical protein